MRFNQPQLLRSALWLVFGIALLLAGCSKPPPDPVQLRADEKTLIHQTVADPARAGRLLELVEQRNRLTDETRAMREEFRRAMYLLNADYEARREVVVEILDVLNRERADRQLRFIELIAAMKAATAAAEWRVIADFQLRYFDPRQMLYRPAEIPEMSPAMLSVFLLGGGLMGGAMLTPAAVDRLEARVAAMLADPGRSADAAQVVVDLDREVEEYNRAFVASASRLQEIHREHGADSRQLLRELEQLNLAWYASQSRIMVLRDRLRESVNADEWARVFPADEPGRVPRN